MFIKTENDKWEKLCFTYELPWKTFGAGPSQGLSKNSKSRIRIGEYTLKPRSDGHRGWRLELEGTGHRTNIQIHRAHKSMYIEGCILPVSFNDMSSDKLKKGDALIQTKSEALMKNIKQRYESLNKNNTGKPTVLIMATLPNQISAGSAYA